ncbi:MAG TPA: hypothetical protein VMC08_08480, partial [Bacteroidales bacterium]|nr:hypothetical protein [Bacteroidales bacterium]
TYESMVSRNMMLDQNNGGSWHHFNFYSLVFRHPRLSHQEFYRELNKVSKSIYHPLRILRRAIKTLIATRNIRIAILLSTGNYHYRRILKEASLLWNKV